MSNQLVSLQPFIPLTPPSPIIMVSESSIQQELSNLFLRVQANARIETDDSLEVFGRDWRVVGINNFHLIPYPFCLPLRDQIDRIWVLLPRSSMHFIEANESGYGWGCQQENVNKALSAVQKHGIPFRQARSSIEGGNCYVFLDPEGAPKAIVGLNSIALTLFSLERQCYFGDHYKDLETIVAEISSPSDDAIYRARNMQFFFDYFMNEFEESDFKKKLLSPLTEDDRRKFFEEARIWEAKDLMARRVIADDLGVPLKNIAFVPQADFHIDMTMTVGVFPDAERVTVYIDTSSPNPDIVPMTKEELERIGCEVILVQGVHTVDGSSINFMNGIFVSTPSGPLYITNGIDPNDPLEQSLLETFERQIRFRAHFIRATQAILTRCRGGIHCLTWERPHYTTPLQIVFSYLDIMPANEKIIEEKVWEVLAVLHTSSIQQQKEYPTRANRKLDEVSKINEALPSKKSNDLKAIGINHGK